jgi:hypothetical protein
MAKVFISYSRQDSEFAKQLTTELQKCELDYWIDWEGIPPTVDWWKEIERGIEEADAFLFILSPDSSKSKVCGMEIDYASKMGKRLIPLLRRTIDSNDAPTQLKHINWLFFRENDDFDAGIQALLTAIHTDYEWVKAHRRLQVRAIEWENGFKDSSLLLRGKDLKEADRQLKNNSKKDPFPTELQKQYVLQSHVGVIRQRRILIIMFVVIFTIFSLSIIAFGQRNAASSARSTAEAVSKVAATQEEIARFVAQRSQNQIAMQLANLAQVLSSEDSIDPSIPPLIAIYSLRTSQNDQASAFLQNYLKQNSQSSASSDEELIADVCAILPRNLTKAEWKTYIASNYQQICPNLPAE